MTYKITNETEGSTEYVDLNPREAFEQALNHLGFYLTYSDGTPILTDGDDIKEFALIDSSDNSLVFNLFEGWYENACLKALTELGYSVEEEQPTNVLHLTF
jgi:hypothetical protein